jgi:hypothetical protein
MPLNIFRCDEKCGLENPLPQNSSSFFRRFGRKKEEENAVSLSQADVIYRRKSTVTL